MGVDCSLIVRAPECKPIVYVLDRHYVFHNVSLYKIEEDIPDFPALDDFSKDIKAGIDWCSDMLKRDIADYYKAYINIVLDVLSKLPEGGEYVIAHDSGHKIDDLSLDENWDKIYK